MSWYGADWQKVRARHLAQPRNRICKHCGTVALARAPKDHPLKAVVDHTIPIRERPDLRLDPSNLETWHKRCHDGAKQSQEKGGTRHLAGCGADGLPLAPGHHWNLP